MAENNGLFRQILTGVSIGFAWHYKEIQVQWKICGSDSMCKAEKLVLYFTKIFGISSPSILLSELLKKYANVFWRTVNGAGSSLIGNNDWTMTITNAAMYFGVEYGLSFFWEWIQYATECLKVDVCEKDDILIWIHNMKVAVSLVGNPTRIIFFTHG